MKKAIIIPRQLKVGAHIYTIEFRNDYELMEKSAGSTRKALLKIVIDDSNCRPQSVIEENFIHELLHAAFTEMGFYWNPDKEVTTTEENLIERLAPILYQILVDNKIQEKEG